MRYKALVETALPIASYIGQTRNEIFTRMNQHRQNGAMLEHIPAHHDIATVSLDELSSNVKNSQSNSMQISRN